MDPGAARIHPLLPEVIRRIVETTQPEKILLFGSAARGTMHAHSDLDLLVIASVEHRGRASERIYERLFGIPVPVDVVVALPTDLATGCDAIGDILRPALREGRVVYAA